MALTVPVHQLNALPLLSADQLATLGDVNIVSGSVIRQFSPAQVGINGTTMNTHDPDPSAIGTDYIILSNWLDVRACSVFTLTLAMKFYNAGEDASMTIGVRMQSPCPADTGTLLDARTGAYGRTAWPVVGTVTMGLTSAGGFPAYKSAAVGWRVGGTAGSPWLQTGMLGSVRVWLNFPMVGDGLQEMYCSLWALT